MFFDLEQYLDISLFGNEFITENKVDYEWIGMNGAPTGMSGYHHKNVALIIHSIN